MTSGNYVCIQGSDDFEVICVDIFRLTESQ